LIIVFTTLVDELDAMSPTEETRGKDVLENMSFGSDDLEDSILGGLANMGGGGVTKKSSSSKSSVKLPATTKTIPSGPSHSADLSDSDDFDVGQLLGAGSAKLPLSLSTAEPVTRQSFTSDKDGDEAESVPSLATDIGGFVPSFLDNGRKTRARRYMIPIIILM